MVAGTDVPVHGFGGRPTVPWDGVFGDGGKIGFGGKVVVPALTCPLMAQVWASRALNEKLTSVSVLSCQMICMVPDPWVAAQAFELENLLGMNVQLKVPAAGAPAVVVVPVPVKV